MKPSLLPYLACPQCSGELLLEAPIREAEEIMEGKLCCAKCASAFPILKGIPRFADLSTDETQRGTAENFGAQWLEFDHVEAHHTQQFLDWISPVTPDFIRGKLVVEGGCGKARHTRLAGEWGAREIVGVDLSRAVEAAYKNTRDLPNAHIIQADIYQLPLRPVFDYAFSVGVLHHLPDPQVGFASLATRLRPGGAISAWIYGRENNGWIVQFVNPVRRRITSKMPMRMLYVLSYAPAAILYLILKLVYAPLENTPLARRLFYAEYMNYIAKFPFREIHNIVHDHLTAPVAFYIRREEFAAWFAEAGAEKTEIHWHNRNSWRGFGRMAAREARAEAGHAG